MIMINMLSGLIGNIGQKANVQGAGIGKPFKRHLTIADGDAAYNTAAEVYGAIGAVGVWSLIWQYTVPAQTFMHWGFGSPAYPDNQGYMWFCILDSGTDFSQGDVRLIQANASQHVRYPVLDVDDSQLHTATVTTLATATPVSRLEKFPLPEKTERPLVGENSLLQIWYRLRVAATAADNAGFSIPVTTYE